LASLHRFVETVLLVGPCRETFVTDEQRRTGFEDAVEEYERLVAAYRRLAYSVVVLAKSNVSDRADAVLRELAGPRSSNCRSNRLNGKGQS
jgi:predicted ATPase